MTKKDLLTRAGMLAATVALNLDEDGNMVDEAGEVVASPMEIAE